MGIREGRTDKSCLVFGVFLVLSNFHHHFSSCSHYFDMVFDSLRLFFAPAFSHMLWHFCLYYVFFYFFLLAFHDLLLHFCSYVPPYRNGPQGCRFVSSCTIFLVYHSALHKEIWRVLALCSKWNLSSLQRTHSHFDLTSSTCIRGSERKPSFSKAGGSRQPTEEGVGERVRGWAQEAQTHWY